MEKALTTVAGAVKSLPANINWNSNMNWTMDKNVASTIKYVTTLISLSGLTVFIVDRFCPKDRQQLTTNVAYVEE